MEHPRKNERRSAHHSLDSARTLERGLPKGKGRVPHCRGAGKGSETIAEPQDLAQAQGEGRTPTAAGGRLPRPGRGAHGSPWDSSRRRKRTPTPECSVAASPRPSEARRVRLGPPPPFTPQRSPQDAGEGRPSPRRLLSTRTERRRSRPGPGAAALEHAAARPGPRPGAGSPPPPAGRILTAERPRAGAAREGAPAAGGYSPAGLRGSGRERGTGARRRPHGCCPRPGPRVPAPRTAAVPAPPRASRASARPSPS